MADTWNYAIINFFLPGVPVLLMALGWLIKNRLRKTALALFWSGVLTLWLAATPALGLRWVAWVEGHYPPLDPTALPQADVIVVLSGGRRAGAAEFGRRDSVLFDTLERTRYAAFLAKRTSLPVVASGGRMHTNATALGVSMKDILQNELGVANVQAEDQSRTTLENAQFTARLLGPGKTVLLVTSAIHMPRAMMDFKQQGVQVIAAPTAFNGNRSPRRFTWIPSVSGLRLTTDALRETLGMLRSHARGFW